MSENNNSSQNPYNNELALKELLKMMKRKEKITVSFLLDEYGYECAELESKSIVDKFPLQLSYDLYKWLVEYIREGEIEEPIPSAWDDLLKREYKNTNDMTESGLIDLLERGIDIPFLKILPEIIDKPGRLTAIYTYKYGCIVFRVKRNEKIIDLLNSKGF